jgi:lipopolysaccharide transport system permease protein
LWFWATPIIWNIDRIPEKFRKLTLLNPFTPFVNAYRDIILHNKFPQALTWFLVIIIGILVFLLGSFVFHKKQRRFAEEI